MIYFIQAGDSGPIKIGSCVDVSARIKTLQPGCWMPLNVIATHDGALAAEKAIHCALLPYRLLSEWYLPTPQVLAAARDPDGLGQHVADRRAADIASGRAHQHNRPKEYVLRLDEGTERSASDTHQTRSVNPIAQTTGFPSNANEGGRNAKSHHALQFSYCDLIIGRRRQGRDTERSQKGKRCDQPGRVAGNPIAQTGAG